MICDGTIRCVKTTRKKIYHTDCDLWRAQENGSNFTYYKNKNHAYSFKH